MMFPSNPSSLMKGRLKQSASGDFNLEDNVSVGSALGRKSEIDFLQDDKSEMTWGRRIALSLMDKTWYNPRAGETDEAPTEGGLSPVSARSFERTISQKPSLDKAWAYFEHVSLYRYILEDKPPKPRKGILTRVIRKFQKGDKKLEKAEPGEADVKTKLYDPFFTPHTQLGDFGLGIGLYFSTLRAITIITLIAGLISIYNINYFSSDAYMPIEFRQQIKQTLAKGSAICTMTSWVPCPNCTCTEEGASTRENRGRLERNRCGEDEITKLRFAMKNDCDGTPWQLGFVNYTTVIMLLVATVLLGEYLRRQEVQFDEDEQTAQDYSVRISNPPSDANDPDEWHRFFEENCDGAQVTVCTCAVDNDFLVRTLVERREILRTIQNSVEQGTSMDNLNLAYLAAKEERERNWLGRLLSSFVSGMPEHYARFVALQAKVQGLAQLEYPTTNVFLTFETEKDQRRVLHNLSLGSIEVYRNNTSALKDPKHLFRGKHVLAVSEPDEPNTIRWQDLNAKFLQKLKEQALTILCTIAAIVTVAVIVRIANDASPLGAAFAIAGFNSVFPIFAKALTNLEAHAAEGGTQTSLYFKIAVFRWVNTAIVITIVTPFTDTLANENGLIQQIAALFFAEIVTTSAIQLADPMGHVNRHILAPRAATQDGMNLMFQGTEFELAERYTDMTKILFLCLWYCAIYPASFFMCSVSLLAKYFVDRFSVMRTWKRAPSLGTGVSKFSRLYFFSLACVAMVVISSYYWSGFPFDNICPNDSLGPDYMNKTFTVWPLDGKGDGTRVEFFESSDVDFRFCNQDLLSPGRGGTFPFIPEKQPEGNEWMTDDQELVTLVFGWSSVAIMILVLLKFVAGWVESARSLFRSSYETVGDDQNIPFSEVTSRCAYIPQVHSKLFSYPLLACDSDHIDEELYDWNDPDRPYSFYDLSKDAKKMLAGMEIQENVGFTRVKHWPPKKKIGNGQVSPVQNGEDP